METHHSPISLEEGDEKPLPSRLAFLPFTAPPRSRLFCRRLFANGPPRFTPPLFASFREACSCEWNAPMKTHFGPDPRISWHGFEPLQQVLMVAFVTVAFARTKLKDDSELKRLRETIIDQEMELALIKQEMVHLRNNVFNAQRCATNPNQEALQSESEHHSITVRQHNEKMISSSLENQGHTCYRESGMVLRDIFCNDMQNAHLSSPSSSLDSAETASQLLSSKPHHTSTSKQQKKSSINGWKQREIPEVCRIKRAETRRSALLDISNTNSRDIERSPHHERKANESSKPVNEVDCQSRSFHSEDGQLFTSQDSFSKEKSPRNALNIPPLHSSVEQLLGELESTATKVARMEMQMKHLEEIIKASEAKRKDSEDKLAEALERENQNKMKACLTITNLIRQLQVKDSAHEPVIHTRKKVAHLEEMCRKKDATVMKLKKEIRGLENKVSDLTNAQTPLLLLKSSTLKVEGRGTVVSPCPFNIMETPPPINGKEDEEVSRGSSSFSSSSSSFSSSSSSSSTREKVDPSMFVTKTRGSHCYRLQSMVDFDKLLLSKDGACSSSSSVPFATKDKEKPIISKRRRWT